MRWGKSEWLYNADAYFPQFLCSATSAAMMALRTHPMILSNLTPEQVFESDTGILHALLSGNLTLTIQYWITTRSILLTFTQDLQESVYDVLSFTLFSSEAAWKHLRLEQAISNTISVQLGNTNPPIFPSLASSI